MTATTIRELADELGYEQNNANPHTFLDWYKGYRGDLTAEELAELAEDSEVENDVADALREDFANME